MVKPLIPSSDISQRRLWSEPAGTGELIDRARAGDTDAFEKLYRQEVARVFAICLRMVGDRGRAEDLTQEAFVRAWHKLDSFRGDSPLGAWLRRVTVNVVLGDRRSRLRRELLEVPLEDDRPVRSRADGGARADGAARVDLEGAIARLPDGARAVFVLHDVEGYTHEEVGELLEVRPNTSKTQLHRARRLLREALTS